MVDGNPADLVDVNKLLDHDYQEQRDRLLSTGEIQELQQIFTYLVREYVALPAGQKYSGIRPVNSRVQCAVWICLSTLCRIGELLKAEWRYVDLDKGTWFIPAEATKGHKGKRQDLHIFLSAFALNQFKRLRQEAVRCERPHLLRRHVCRRDEENAESSRQLTAQAEGQGDHNDVATLPSGESICMRFRAD